MSAPLEITSLSALDHILQNRPNRIQRILVGRAESTLSGRLAELVAKARERRIHVDFQPKGTRDEEAVRALLAPFAYGDFKALLAEWAAAPKGVVLALDHLQDPQNFGAICRSAEGLGASGIVIPKDRGVGVTAGVYSASVGAVETIPIVSVTNLGDALRKLKEAGFWIVGATKGEEATSFDKMPTFERVALVMGSELEGLSPSLSKLCDWRLEIPMRGRVESLNVGAASSILLYELCRRL